ncbi:hypothetical protein GHI93_05645 [Lactococcus hircilactis]|uniref:DUF5648 domain-containing protein n=1 Tax=Lactococcus hircilactis TaxID=1494462 RepID=A0A7X1Z9Y6_9LACT|nr:hypothetical protein [Lactococcus hircilactis]MQW39422.1 hypothetical protein [Lactococcus hircilactis]
MKTTKKHVITTLAVALGLATIITLKTTAVSATTATSKEVPIYRLYNDKTGEHLFTSSLYEAEVLYTKSWTYENIGWIAPSTGKPVYRLYNPTLHNHLYTTDTYEVKVLTTRQGWVTDNNGKPLFYSGGNNKVYRLYNPTSTQHLLSTDTYEYNVLGQHGWNKEGVKLYDIGQPTSAQIKNAQNAVTAYWNLTHKDKNPFGF